MHLNLEAQGGGQEYPLMSVVQIADITRPLMSVTKIRDQGLECAFRVDKAVVRNAKGQDGCELPRRGGICGYHEAQEAD